MPAKKQEAVEQPKEQPKEAPQDDTQDTQLLAAVSTLLQENPDLVLGAAQKMSPENQRKLREAIGAGGITRQKKNRQLTNDSVKNLVLAHGNVHHHDPNWRPKATGRVAEKGPEAVAEFHRRWEDGEHAAITGGQLDQYGGQRGDISRMVAEEGVVTA